MFRLEFWVYVKLFFLATLVAIFVFFELDNERKKEYYKGGQRFSQVFETYNDDMKNLKYKVSNKSIEQGTRRVLKNIISRVPVTKEPQKVLVLTMWRSGSTWTGNLLSKIPNSFYIYEPLHLIQYFWNESSINKLHGSKVNLVEQLLNCVIPSEFVKHLDKFSVMYKSAKCKSFMCNMHQIMTEECQNSSFRIIKTNRLQLQEVEEMFLKETLKNLKVIYLVRDPRGVINSLRHIDKKYIDVSIDEVCPRMRGDVAIYPVLKKLYPEKFFFLRYEDLANLSLPKAKELWCFVHGEENCPVISPNFIEYIERSANLRSTKGVKRIGGFGTSKKSSQDWQIWRQDITESFLKAVENNCGDIIRDLGYRSFGSINKTRKSSLSSLRYENCKIIPCGS